MLKVLWDYDTVDDSAKIVAILDQNGNEVDYEKVDEIEYTHCANCGRFTKSEDQDIESDSEINDYDDELCSICAAIERGQEAQP